MAWTVTLHREVAKVVQGLPEPVQDLLRLLLHELEGGGRCVAIGPTMANFLGRVITAISKRVDRLTWLCGKSATDGNVVLR
jgi:hypothetical protein